MNYRPSVAEALSYLNCNAKLAVIASSEEVSYLGSRPQYRIRQFLIDSSFIDILGRLGTDLSTFETSR